MIQKNLLFIALLVMIGINAQENTASPYSLYALGDVKFRGTIENRMMGGLSIYSDSIHVNLQNPASYSHLKLTTYTAALTYNNLTFKSENDKEKAETISFDYLALGFPISKKMGAGIGVMPYTAVGYRLENSDESQPDIVTNRYTGEGGINRVYFSLGYAVTKALSIGVTGNYNFGKLENETLRVIEDVTLATREKNRSDISGLDLNFAVNYQKTIAKKYQLYATLLYAPGHTLQSENNRTLSTVSITSSGVNVQESIPIDLESINLKNTKLTIPSSITFGLGVGKQKKWFAGASYTSKNMSTFSNPFITVDGFTYENNHQFSAGGFFIPQYDSFTKYWNRITYRFGIRYEKTGFRIDNTTVNDFGISFGVGLPLGGYVPNANSLIFAGLFSNINVGFDIGKRGKTDFGIQENYFNVNLSLSLNDKWFVKRKYD